MKSFVSTWRVQPPRDIRLMVRFGASVCDAFHSALLKQWFALIPGGNPEKISEPPMWWCDEEYASSHQRENASSKSDRESKRPAQLSLF